MANLESVRTTIAALFANGPVEVGLEVGSDPGLAREHYIAIPESMRGDFYVKVVGDKLEEIVGSDLNPAVRYTQAHVDNTALGLPEAALGEEMSAAHLDLFAASECVIGQDGAPPIGWFRVAHDNGAAVLAMYMGTTYLVFDANLWGTDAFSLDSTDFATPILKYYKAPPSLDALRAFYDLNISRVTVNGLDQSVAEWAMNVRLWSVVSGYATPRVIGNDETIVVPDPANPTSAGDTWIQSLGSQAGEAFTALAARVTSWKKSNHATGGLIATGYPQRYMQKAQFWDPVGATNDNERTRYRQAATTAFYRATHPASVHFGLANLVPDDNHHYAIFSGHFGYIGNMEARESTGIRLAPRTQVAGTAIPVDAIAVLKLVVKDNLAPLLRNYAQAPALVQAVRDVGGALDGSEPNTGYGMRAGVYAKWYFASHPKGISAVQFNQKDPSFYELASELAIIATTYYSRTTIGRAAALRNTASAAADQGILGNWKRLEANRSEMSGDQFIDAARVLSGNMQQGDVALVSSAVAADRARAVEFINGLHTNLYGMLSLGAAPVFVHPEDAAAAASTGPGPAQA